MTRVLTADVETSIHNKGNPFDKRNKCVSIHVKKDALPPSCTFFDQPNFITPFKNLLADSDVLVGTNLKFDLHWLRNLGAPPVNILIWDCMVAEFILSGQVNSFASLDSLAERYGLSKKLDKVKEYWDVGISTEDIPREIVEEYGNYDVDLTYQVYLCQQKDPRMTQAIYNLILLSGEDLKVLQEMEYTGLKYNVEESIARAEKARSIINKIEWELLQYVDVTELNFDSDDQLSAYLYGGSITKETYTPVTSIVKSGPNKGMERTINRHTGSITTKFDGFFNPLPDSALKKEGLYSTSGDTLKQLKARTKVQKEIIEKLLKRADLVKLTGTYYEGLPKLMKEMYWGDTIHGQYNQVVARTGRLSSSRPNMQNNPAEADQLFESRYG